MSVSPSSPTETEPPPNVFRTMTPEEKYGAKLLGSAIAIIVLMIVAILVAPKIAALLEDGHRAYPPSAYDSRR